VFSVTVSTRHCLLTWAIPRSLMARELCSLTAVWSLCYKDSWSLLCSPGTGHTENTASHNYSVFVVLLLPQEPAVTPCLQGHSIAMGVFAEPFPRNSCLCWFHSSGFQQTCHRIKAIVMPNLCSMTITVKQNRVWLAKWRWILTVCDLQAFNILCVRCNHVVSGLNFFLHYCC
jgi:hypothetical protein